jgi:outer membrane protein OmpA-like peptidoglycan-associated protein
MASLDEALKPTPAAQPLAPAATNYLVFFEWNSAALTPQAAQVLADAARHIKSADVSEVRIVGHADRSGTSAYNMDLSRRRAQAVSDHLVEIGVPREATRLSARGEEEPLVSTADGVREPQNRRVEIVAGGPQPGV